MLRHLPLTSLIAACFLAACSPGVPAPAAPKAREQAASRADLEGVMVDGAGSNGEAARAAAKAEKVATLKKLLERLGKAERLNDAFATAEEIEDLGKDIKDELIAGLKTLPAMPRIAGLRALYTCTGYDEAVQGLLALVIADGDNQLRASAAEVLGTVASERHTKLLTEALNKQVFEPEVRVQLALALWNSSRDIEAKRVLRGMLTSDNESFRIAAALALGETQDFTDAKPILEMLAEEPTLRGRVARRMLEWEKEIKRLEAILQGNIPGEKKPERIDTRLLETVQTMIQERYIYPDHVSGRKLLYAAASGMLEGFDPYTCLLEDNQLRDAAEIRRFAVPTLGITLGKVRMRATRRERVTVVLSVLPGSPADKAGIRPLDRVFRVVKDVTPERVAQLRVSERDLPHEDKSLQSLPLDEAISRFKGAVGQSCALQFRREPWLLSRWVYMVHSAPVDEPVLYETLPGGFGMIHVHELSATAPARISEAVAAFKKAGAKGIMLDLRGAAGGSIEAATQVAALFLPKGTRVAYSMGRSEQLAPKTDYKTSESPLDSATPLVVMTDGGTADSAEVLAAALKEHGRARTAGSRTFGRALLQELIPLNASEPDSDKRKLGLLLTVARYYTPVTGYAIYDRGIDADVALSDSDFEGWVYDELEAAQKTDVWKNYMDGLIGAVGEDKAVALALTDERKPENYPRFDALHKELKLHVDRDALRHALRADLRQRLRQAGKLANLVDLQEDKVFTGALKELAKAAGVDLSKIPDYAVLKN